MRKALSLFPLTKNNGIMRWTILSILLLFFGKLNAQNSLDTIRSQDVLSFYEKYRYSENTITEIAEKANELIFFAEQQQQHSLVCQLKRHLSEISRQKKQKPYQLRFLKSALQYAEKHKISHEIALSHIGLGNYYKEYRLDQAALHFRVAIQILKTSPSQQEMGEAYQELSIIEYQIGDYEKSIKLAQDALNLQPIEDNNLISVLNTLGLSWKGLKNYEISLRFFNDALQIAQKIRHQTWIGISMGNIGEVHFLMGNYLAARTFLEKDIHISSAKQNWQNVGNALNILTQIAIKENKFAQAALIFKQIDSLNQKYQLRSKVLVNTFLNRSELEKKRQNYSMALFYYQRFIQMKDSMIQEERHQETRKVEIEFEAAEKESKIRLLEQEQLNAQENQNKQNQTIWIISTILILVLFFLVVFFKKNKRIASINHVLKTQHEDILDQKEKLSSQNNLLEKQKQKILSANLTINVINKVGRKITASLEKDKITEILHQDLSTVIDTYAFGIGIYNVAYQRLDFEYFIEENVVLKIHSERLDEDKLSVHCFSTEQTIFIHDIENEYQKYLSHLPQISVGKLCHSVIYVPIKTKQKKLGVMTVQSLQKFAYRHEVIDLMEMLASFVAIALDNSEAYQIIRTKNAQITNGILYARTIQESILPTNEKLAELLGEHFIIFKPKEIVSGDFYWATQTHDEVIFALADCTGHGVSGGFMTLIGVTLLNQIIKKEGKNSPAYILKKLNIGILHTLRQLSIDSKDGMEIAICKLTKTDDGHQLVYSGSKLSLYIFKDGFLKAPASRKYLGSQHIPDDFFDFELFIPTQSTYLYLTTDGIFDLHDSLHRRFGTTRWEELIKQCQEMDFLKQKDFILKKIWEHQQEMPQRDDISIFGLYL